LFLNRQHIFLFIYKKYIEMPPKLDLAAFLFVNLFSITYLSYFFLPFLFDFYNPFSYLSSFFSYFFFFFFFVFFLFFLFFFFFFYFYLLFFVIIRFCFLTSSNLILFRIFYILRHSD